MHVGQTNIGPRGARISRLVNAVAFQLLARADVNDVRVRWRDYDSANRRHVNAIKDRFPGAAAIARLPNAAARRAEVVNRLLAGNARHSGDATGPMRTNQP